MGTKTHCRCGELLRWSQIPNPIEWVFMSDAKLIQLPDTVDYVALVGELNRFLKCPSCGRLVVFWNGFGQDPEFYLPES